VERSAGAGKRKRGEEEEQQKRTPVAGSSPAVDLEAADLEDFNFVCLYYSKNPELILDYDYPRF
jgi:hypothetical protein